MVKSYSFKERIVYLAIANLLFVIHFLLILLVVFGWALPGFFYVFLIAIIFTFLSDLFLGYCFLSKWEFGLRKKLNPSAEFDKSCIVHYIRALFGLKPKPFQDIPKNFFKKYLFSFMLVGLVIIAVFYNFYLY